MFRQALHYSFKRAICKSSSQPIFKIRAVQQKNVLLNFNRPASSDVALDISGIYPPIVTTFDQKGNISYHEMSHNIKKWNSIPLKGYVVLGSNGESVALSEDEKVNLVKHVKEVSSPDKLIIGGSGCYSTRDTIELTNKMASVGAKAVMVISPFFYKGRMTEDVLYEHYTKVADASNVPVILYSVPMNTLIDLSASLVARLADHPNIIGMKDSGGDVTKIALIVHKTKGKNFQLLAGSAGFFYPGLCVGCVGGVLGLANVLGEQVCQLYEYATTGKHEEARLLHHRIIGPNLAVTSRFSIPGLKAIMDILGYKGGFCRPPLKSLTPQELNQVKEEFKSNGFL